MNEDVGVDATIVIGQSSPSRLEFGVQVKAVGNLPRRGTYLSHRVRRSDLVYWASRLVPTMCVVYDDKNRKGYYAWAADLIAQHAADLERGTSTLTIRIPMSSEFGESSWWRIQKDVENDYRRVVKDLSPPSVVARLLPTIHSLANALRIMHAVQYRPLPASTDEAVLEEAIRASVEIAAHGEVVSSLGRLLAALPQDSRAFRILQNARGTYKTDVSQYLDNFDDALESKELIFFAFNVNYKGLQSARPRLTTFLADTLAMLSSPPGLRPTVSARHERESHE